MARRITRLQVIFLIIIFFLVFSICKRFYWAWQISSKRKIAVIEKQEESVKTTETADIDNVQLENLEQKAKHQIAVKGFAVRIYTVRRGDCLWNISRKHYRKGSNWYYIWKANEEKIPNFDRIYRGQKISIPDLYQ